ncbi:CehA/McbA family metallohydrolase [Phenylobacterium sp.]|uniref:CehA/McbA family metallohydrolase n=1 Tax=Phenylobacterium sp. TaxID=1871053 RepID=UPI00271F7506|nr:CehA/McbA family metallohydrolase [Phenylobacterium sp.]MDO8802626.1 CehA/McbA family metallohydrolase [Phenylobacterium sp.]
MRHSFHILTMLVVLVFGSAARAQQTPDLTLAGALTGADHQTYREVPFRVPAGVTAITVAFDYSGRDQKATIDLGVRDPQRFRGWSGGNKASFTISDAEATPSYLAGPLPAGTWRLVLGAPNIRKGTRAAYRAKIWFERAGDAPTSLSATPVRAGPGWYRGDLHLHTAHSDGTCLSRRGLKVPCPVFKTLEAASERGLDFIAVTDHNTASQNGALRELAPFYDDLLLIAGREITTFQGHANVFGPTGALDFQLGSSRVPTLARLLDAVSAAGGVFSINHPALPSGELCMGCGWTVAGTPYERIGVMEVVNGGALALAGGKAEGLFSGIAFWEARLNEGHQITAIGGSDNHDATLGPGKAPAVGMPTTVVRGADLSQAAILAGLQAGHVFIDISGSRDRLIEVTAQAGDARAEMGDVLAAPAGTTVRVTVRIVGGAGGQLSLAGPAARLAKLPDAVLASYDETTTFDLISDGIAGWLRVDLRGADGQLVLLTNPIYLRSPNTR